MIAKYHNKDPCRFKIPSYGPIRRASSAVTVSASGGLQVHARSRGTSRGHRLQCRGGEEEGPKH